ncbi:MAG: hypothetical protein PVG63_09025, partial [Anaerolineales bacterium]
VHGSGVSVGIVLAIVFSAVRAGSVVGVLWLEPQLAARMMAKSPKKMLPAGFILMEIDCILSSS